LLCMKNPPIAVPKICISSSQKVLFW
jgi:hypothetical protein